MGITRGVTMGLSDQILKSLNRKVLLVPCQNCFECFLEDYSKVTEENYCPSCQNKQLEDDIEMNYKIEECD